MKRIGSLAIFGTLMLVHPLQASSHELECAVVENDDKIIQCTFSSVRLATDRNITFFWNSQTTPQDDRERSFVLPAGHGSVYDYRYYYGRAPGIWQVRVADDSGKTLAETSFTIK